MWNQGQMDGKTDRWKDRQMDGQMDRLMKTIATTALYYLQLEIYLASAAETVQK